MKYQQAARNGDRLDDAAVDALKSMQMWAKRNDPASIRAVDDLIAWANQQKGGASKKPAAKKPAAKKPAAKKPAAKKPAAKPKSSKK
jgi:hypothetical protein